MRSGETHWTRRLKKKPIGPAFASPGVPAIPEPVRAIPAPEQGERRVRNTQTAGGEQAAGADAEEQPDVRRRGVLPEYGRQSVAGSPEAGQRCGGTIGAAQAEGAANRRRAAAEGGGHVLGELGRRLGG